MPRVVCVRDCASERAFCNSRGGFSMRIFNLAIWQPIKPKNPFRPNEESLCSWATKSARRIGSALVPSARRGARPGHGDRVRSPRRPL